MRVEVINTGTELLLGHVTNTHLTTIARSLFGIGLRVEQQITVPDGPAITHAIAEAKKRGGILVITGGLGPTSDDITREAAAEVYGRPLHFHEETWNQIAQYFTTSGFKMNEMQKRQALVPEGALVLANAWGTAPGLILEDSACQSIAILLPGPPRELSPMWDHQVMPWLKQRLASELKPLHEIQLRVLGIGESRVQMAVEEGVLQRGVTEVGYCARMGEVDLRLLGSSQKTLKMAADYVHETLGEAIYAEGHESMEEVVIRLAREKRKTLAVAESCTGGFISHRLTNVSRSSEAFRYGWITYSNEAKITELGVLPALLEEHGAVSAPVARAMAEGALHRSGADLALAVTGIAGPSGATETKPIGLVYFGLARRKQTPGDSMETQTMEKTLKADRESFKYLASQIGMNFLRMSLK